MQLSNIRPVRSDGVIRNLTQHFRSAFGTGCDYSMRCTYLEAQGCSTWYHIWHDKISYMIWYHIYDIIMISYMISYHKSLILPIISYVLKIYDIIHLWYHMHMISNASNIILLLLWYHMHMISYFCSMISYQGCVWYQWLMISYVYDIIFHYHVKSPVISFMISWS